MKKTLSVAIFTAVAALAGQSALAHPVSKVTPGYAGDSNGMVVTDSSGNCVRSGIWTPAMATEACDAGLMSKKAAAPAPAPVKAEPAPAPKPAPQPVTEKVSLKAGALFDVNKADLKPAGKSELDALAAKLKDAQVEQITVTGHTDSSGSKPLNQSLSERRADAVKAYLVSKGLDGSRIDTKGAGDTQPVASNSTAAGRAQNRRVEIDIRAQRTAN
ncbi:MAG: OmpA family protein [Pseudomonadota bacterium]